GAMCGSLLYSAPEQIREGGRHIDARTDIFALGLMLHELSSGEHPFFRGNAAGTIHRLLNEEACHLRAIDPGISPFFEALVAWLLMKHPERRPEAVSIVADVLSRGEASAWWSAQRRKPATSAERPVLNPRVRRDTRLLGRSKELATLDAAFDRAKSGRGCVFLVEGEPGIGKTRLVEEWLGKLLGREPEVLFLSSTYAAPSSGEGAGGILEALRAHLEATGGEEHLTRLLSSTPRLVGPFAAVLRGLADKNPEPLSREAVQMLVGQTFTALSAEKPVILFLDDLHLADEKERESFAGLTFAAQGNPFVIVGAGRRGDLEDWAARLERLDLLSRMALPSLDAEAIRDMLIGLRLAGRDVDRFLSPILERSTGNPLFVLEIVRGLQQDERTRRSPDGTWSVRGEGATIPIPGTMKEILAARIAALTPDQRGILEAASCCGFEFDPVLISEALGSDPISVMKGLATLEREHRLVRAEGPKCRFEHHPLAEEIRDRLPLESRRDLHRKIGMAVFRRLSSIEPGDVREGGLAAALCLHMFRAGLQAQALPHLDLALRHLDLQAAHHSGVALAEAALEQPGAMEDGRRVDLMLYIATRHEMLGRRRDEENALARALEAADRTTRASLKAETRRRRGLLLVRSGRHEEAREMLETALLMASEAGDSRLLANATANLGFAFSAQGRHEEALVHLSEGLALCTRSGDLDGVAQANGSMGLSLCAMGRLHDARVRMERHLGIARTIGRKQGEAVACGTLGELLTLQGAFEDALTCLEESLRLAREYGLRRGEGYAMHDLAALSTLASNDAGTERLWVDALGVRRTIGYPAGIAVTAAGYGGYLLGKSRFEEARKLLSEALSRAVMVRAPEPLVAAAVDLARLPEGDIGAARLAVEEYEHRLACSSRMVAHFHLWRLGGEPENLETASALLHHLARHASPDCRESILTRVPLHRAIAEAGRAS
ncbi:MAG: AAA family ATPase, partial [Planctomycetes bacterium]|nr:AAA family ATPase [Planctomycetota bacterium]